MFALFCLLFISPIFCSQAPSKSMPDKEFTLKRCTTIVTRFQRVESICALIKKDGEEEVIVQMSSMDVVEKVPSFYGPWSELNDELSEDKQKLRKRMYALFPAALRYYTKKFQNRPDFAISFNANQIPFQYRNSDSKIFKNVDHLELYLKEAQESLAE